MCLSLSLSLQGMAGLKRAVLAAAVAMVVFHPAAQADDDLAELAQRVVGRALKDFPGAATRRSVGCPLRLCR